MTSPTSRTKTKKPPRGLVGKNLIPDMVMIKQYVAIVDEGEVN